MKDLKINDRRTVRKPDKPGMQDGRFGTCRKTLLDFAAGGARSDFVHENETVAELLESEQQLGRLAQIEAAVASLRGLPREQRVAAMQALLGQIAAIRGSDGDFADLPIEAEVLAQVSEVTLLVGELQAEVSLQGPLQSKSRPGWKVKPRQKTVHVTLPDGTPVYEMDGDFILEKELHVDIEGTLESPEGEEIESDGEKIAVVIVNGFLLSLRNPSDDDGEDDDENPSSKRKASSQLRQRVPILGRSWRRKSRSGS